MAFAVPSTKSSRSLDRRRETSRYAARDRRGKEADIFTDLKDVVPVVEESTVTHVDRIALLRVAATLCRMRKNAGPFLASDLLVDDNPNIWNENTLSECLDGFVIIADSDGTILYITESVSIFLGLTQTDLVGRAIKDFIHPTDYDDLMRISTEEAAANEERRTPDDEAQMQKFGTRMIMRMKTVISPRGRNLNLKSALYKAIVCRCRSLQFNSSRIMLVHASTTPAGQGNSICMTNASIKGSETTSGSFMTRHTCDMRFSYVSENFNYLLRHESRSLMGTSFYELVHPADLELVTDCMRELFRKGHCRSAYYRLIGANSSVAWVQTEATTVNHTTRGQKGQYVLCVHSLVGMQSDVDSWVTAGTACSDVVAAAQPACQYVKAEIEDVAEYLGRQPQFIDCHDFTPLIDVDSAVNLNGYTPARPQTEQPRFSNTTANPPRRKDSYNEVLEWLFRDQPESPAPNTAAFRGPINPPDRDAQRLGDGYHHRTNGFGYQRAQQQFQPCNQSALTPAPSSSSSTYSRGRSLDSRRQDSLVRMGGSDRATPAPLPTSAQQQQYGSRGSVDFRSTSIEAVRQSQGGGHFECDRNGAVAAAAMDDRNGLARGAPVPPPFAGAVNANSSAGVFVDRRGRRGDGRNHAARPAPPPQGLGRYAEQRFGSASVERVQSGGHGRGGSVTTSFSPLAAGLAEFGVGSPSQPQSDANTCGDSRQTFVTGGGVDLAATTPFSLAGQSDPYPRTVSAIPSSDVYPVSSIGKCGPEGPRYQPDSLLFSAVSAAGGECIKGEQQVGVPSSAMSVNQLPVAEPISLEFFEEFKQQNPHLFCNNENDMCTNNGLQSTSECYDSFAPFVPEEDILQLNSEPFPFEVHFPELDLSDFALDNSGLKNSSAPQPSGVARPAGNPFIVEVADQNTAPVAKRARLNSEAPLFTPAY